MLILWITSIIFQYMRLLAQFFAAKTWPRKTILVVLFVLLHDTSEMYRLLHHFLADKSRYLQIILF